MIILAGGFGTRLKSVIDDLPKPMASVAGRPFLEHVLIWAEAQGVKHAILAVSYQWEKIQAHFGNRFAGISLDYSIETVPLGTGGGMRLALERTKEKNIFCCNGDTLFSVDLGKLFSVHAKGYDISIAARHVENASRYGRLQLKESKITGFDEKNETPTPGLINGGVYVFRRDWLSKWPPNKKLSLEREIILGYNHMGAIISDAYFIDIGIPDDYKRAVRELA